MGRHNTSTLTRILSMLRHLARNPEGVTAIEMARRLGCHRATIYRNVTAIQGAGIDVSWDEKNHVVKLDPKWLEKWTQSE